MVYGIVCLKQLFRATFFFCSLFILFIRRTLTNLTARLLFCLQLIVCLFVQKKSRWNGEREKKRKQNSTSQNIHAKRKVGRPSAVSLIVDLVLTRDFSTTIALHNKGGQHQRTASGVRLHYHLFSRSPLERKKKINIANFFSARFFSFLVHKKKNIICFMELWAGAGGVREYMNLNMCCI